MEFCSRRSDGFDENAYLHFMVASNELYVGRILLCPADSAKRLAKDFQSLVPTNVTYQLRSGKNVDEVNQGEILGRCPIHGHVLFCDGSVKVGEKK